MPSHWPREDVPALSDLGEGTAVDAETDPGNEVVFYQAAGNE